MPRVNGVMQPLPNVYGTPGRPIESAKYNTTIDDIISDLNAARPITAGGTGATDQQGARDALGAAALSHTHPVSQISDGGTAGRAIVQGTTTAAVRNYLGLAIPATYSSSMGSQTLADSPYPLASVDFVAAGQSVMATGLMQITAGGTIYGYCRVQLSLVSGGGGNFGSSVENPTIITTNDFKTLAACEVFTGLSIGSTYRAQVYGRTNTGFATSPASFIRALNL